MTSTLSHLKDMISVSGLTGYEAPIRSIIQSAWQPLTDEVSVSNLGSLHALRRGTLPQPRPSVLVATHMDAIGLMVTGITAGLLHLTEVGGIDSRVLPGQLVTVHGEKDIQGVIVTPPKHTLPEHAQNDITPLTSLFIDTGLPHRQLSTLVNIGTLVSFATQPLEINGGLLAGHSLDNRASVAALTQSLTQLQGRTLDWDLWAVATTQEELTLGGGRTSAFHLQPTLSVIIDTTFANGPGSPDHKTFALDGGPTLGWGSNIHPKLFTVFDDLAKELEIPTQLEVMPASSGTDATLIQTTAGGVPTMVISIPIRYMHTPVEVVHLDDIGRTARLLTEFLVSLDANFMDKIRWSLEEDH
ncbi:MAG: M20/M25/M40 family metallo-hydrolase [Anaerolineae bacterium]|nr:M20/M25/M40 family metallo-hydrolase [Anaerolineae bacterium]